MIEVPVKCYCLLKNLRSKRVQNGHFPKAELKSTLHWLYEYIHFKDSSNFIPKMGGLSAVNYTSVRLFFKKLKDGLTSLVAQWLRIQCRRHGFHPWPGKIPVPGSN